MFLLLLLNLHNTTLLNLLLFSLLPQNLLLPHLLMITLPLHTSIFPNTHFHIPTILLFGKCGLCDRVIQTTHKLFDHFYLLQIILVTILCWGIFYWVSFYSFIFFCFTCFIYYCFKWGLFWYYHYCMNFVEGIRSACPKTTMTLQIIGALIILRKLFTLLSRIYQLIRKRKNLTQRYGRNSWVFITGSSEGNAHIKQESVELWH